MNMKCSCLYQSVALRVEVAAHNVVCVPLKGPQAFPVACIPQLEGSIIGS